MFWLNRYVERAVGTIRVVDVTAHLELDSGESDSRELDFWTLLLDAENPDSMVSCVGSARIAARQVRDSISSEMWEQINTTYLTLSKTEGVRELDEDPHTFYRRVRDSLLLIQGLADATVAHDEAWQFLTLGKYLERADNVARLLSVQTHLLGSPGAIYADETVRWLAVLRSAGSSEAYSHYYSLRVDPTRVLEFLLFNSTFPQSVRFSLGAAWSAMESIAQVTQDATAPPVRALGRLRARLEHASIDEVLESGLEPFLGAIQRDIAHASDLTTRAFFRFAPVPERHMAAVRAAQIMAAQQ